MARRTHPDDAVSGVGMISKGEPHPAHAGFGDAIGAERIPVAPVGPPGTVLEDVLSAAGLLRVGHHDVYLAEDAVGLYGAPLLARRGDSTFVLLVAMHRLTMEGYHLRPTAGPEESVRWIDRRLDVGLVRRLLNRYVDGVMAVSELTAETVRRIAPRMPVRVAEPYVQSAHYDRLQSVRPSLDGRTAVFVGVGRDHKGVDTLVEAWPHVRERLPGARLRMVGGGYPDRYGRVEGVSCEGYVEHERLGEVFRDAALYVHPARYDPFPIAPIEAMLAGVPAVVTTRTGTAPYVSDIEERLVVEPRPEPLADAVTWYLQQDTSYRHTVSGRMRELARTFDERSRTDAFARRFADLVSEIR